MQTTNANWRKGIRRKSTAGPKSPLMENIKYSLEGVENCYVATTATAKTNRHTTVLFKMHTLTNGSQDVCACVCVSVRYQLEKQKPKLIRVHQFLLPGPWARMWAAYFITRKFVWCFDVGGVDGACAVAIVFAWLFPQCSALIMPTLVTCEWTQRTAACFESVTGGK